MSAFIIGASVNGVTLGGTSESVGEGAGACVGSNGVDAVSASVTGSGASAAVRLGWKQGLAAARQAVADDPSAAAASRDEVATLSKKFPGCSVVTFSGREAALLREIAEDRNAQNRAAGVREGKRSGRDSVDIDEQGAQGEYGMFRVLDIPEDELFDTSPRCVRTDWGHDIILVGPNKDDVPKTIDVKSSMGWRFTQLRVHVAKRQNPASFYAHIALFKSFSKPTSQDDPVLVAVCVGYATGDLVFSRRLFQHDPYYQVSENNLTKGLPSF